MLEPCPAPGGTTCWKYSARLDTAPALDGAMSTGDLPPTYRLVVDCGMFQMMGVFAEFERAMIQERVRAGLRRARSEGKQLGRPPPRSTSGS